MTSQVIDRGNIMIAVDQYPEKVNGQAQLNQDGSPKMKNKWMKIGEETKWRHDDGRISTNQKIYLRPLVQGKYQEQVTWWESEKQDNQNQQQSGFNQAPAQQGGFNQQGQGGFNQNNNGFNQQS